MTATRKTLFAQNTQLRAQLAACAPESRNALKSRLASARADLEKANKEINAMRFRLESATAPL